MTNDKGSKMYARVMTLHVREGQLDRVVRTLQQIVVPAANRQRGFAGMLVMSDREAHKVVSSSLWHSETDMLASEEAEYFQDQISRLVTMISGPPAIDRYEVNVMS